MKAEGVAFRVCLLALALASALWGYRLMLLDHLPTAFNSELEDLSYGWYVPVFSAYVLWRERRELVASLGEPSLAGMLLLVPSLLVGFAGVRGLQVRFEVLGFVGLLISLAWAFFGGATAKRVLFPALFLLFCMPLHSFLDIVTIHLRQLAVAVAYGAMKGVGVEIVREGTMLASPTGSFAIDIAEPCSGLRSLFAMAALTAGYAYFTQPTWLRRGILFALSIPIAVAGNIVRIFSIVAIAATCSSEFATGFYHDYSGYVVFLVAISLMVACGELVTRGAERCAQVR